MLGCRKGQAQAQTPLPGAPGESDRYTNHLAGEKSPYLLQHAHNPVNWFPWGDEAFAEAQKLNKPIFLSIGYSTCHWCHVMERESFSDPAMAKLIDDHFVAIKVDREERPDVDAVYMDFVVATTGSGGWPMTVFLTPDRKPFFGGTYFPPEDRDGMPGLKTVLTKAAAAWANDRGNVAAAATRITAALQQATALTPASGGADGAAIGKAYEQFSNSFDARYGGFGQAPKFPRPVVLNFLIHHSQSGGPPQALTMVLQTLRQMAGGGMHDQLAGGFHRYSTDARWFLPHFEKMLYDQAQLASAYLDAYQVTRDPFIAAVARDTLDYVLRDMTGPDGEFYSAEDADSARDAAHPDQLGEGAFYVWTASEIEKTLGKQAAEIVDYLYGVELSGNVEADPRNEFTGQNVLYAAHSSADAAAKFAKSSDRIERDLAAAKHALLQSRSHRPRPRRDDKTLASWNGLMISAFARAGAVLNEPRYTAAAIKAGDFVCAHLYDSTTHRLRRRWRDGQAHVPGLLEDYAFLIESFIDLYESGRDIRWLRLALDLQQAQDDLFWDKELGGYFQTSGADASVLLRLKDGEDDAEPAGNSIAALNLLRLGRMIDDADLRGKAQKTFALFAGRISSSPTAMPQMLLASEFLTSKAKQIVLAGAPDSPGMHAMLEAVHARYLPNAVILGADGGEGQKFLAQHVAFLKDVHPIDGKATAYVCENFVCQLPTTDLSELKKLLSGAAAASKPSGD